MKVLIIIPARGGSKGVPKKNIKLLGGKPLIVHAIECAKHSALSTDVIVSTDNEEIEEIALAANCKVIKRPNELADDKSNVVDAVLHTLDNLDDQYDLVALLQPTAPLRTGTDLDKIIQMFNDDDDVEGVISVIPMDDIHPARMYNLSEELNMESYIADGETLRRQDLKPVYYRNGCFYVVRVAALLREKTLMVKNKKGYIMDPNWLVNIDNNRDLKIAEVLFEDWKNENFNN
ncbi:acylneuraminate cytidylyltransferase family protein [Flavobacterium amniphilum]|uniref:acylneuraminate cytidylyltransferase family protein n=1 Tax=Flavobacterium amniphilum TaxID=1834035 RepID=UPI00202AABC6|nr:acylneuraminate cytidylyltransferase family protein [Flavobacterium amniphilum]MCL9805103.1 acylneuraminate cytidylyltransferase family protein [Flavobacterium amniphilum]